MKKKDVLVENNEETQELHKKKRKFRDFIPLIVIIVSLLLIAVEGVLYYQRSYLTPFWVNGQSMYPTLNEEATFPNGQKIGKEGGSATVGSIVDYGVMDEHQGAIDKLKRFDIVITKYLSNDTDSSKIKRVVGLPGETVEFKNTGSGNKNNGDLYINGKLVEQPLKSEYVVNGSYQNCKWVLKNNEYIVCGDNRNHSYDSRNSGVGPISKDKIKGKAIAICGKAEVYVTDSGKLGVKNIDYFWPRYL